MRKIEKLIQTHGALEGAGVRLKRGFSYHDARAFDPFLMFDDFSNEDAEAYKRGFPMHPHRGIETVTYLRAGRVQHRDSTGSEGVIGAGDVQWMTAGSGVMHEEMPQVGEEGIQGFQLWVNLPAQEKMTPPRYRGILSADIPCIKKDGSQVRVIAGQYEGISGPLKNPFVPVTYFDVTLEARALFSYRTHEVDTYFMYVYAGRASLRDDRSESWVGSGEIALLTHDRELAIRGGKDGVQFLLIGGTPLHEPVVPYGPIVMNSEDEIQTALAELRDGTFIKK